MAQPQVSVIKILVGDRRLQKCSYAWRIWSGGTSFYIKPLAAWGQAGKVSLHGPDLARGLPGGYKFEIYPEASGAVGRKGATLVARDGGWPNQLWFPGWNVRADIDLALRLRFPWDLFTPEAATAPAPPEPSPDHMAGLIPVPRPDHAVDIDIFVSRATPYWPNEAQSHRDNASLGPVVNRAGEYLTGQVVHREIASEPSPLAGHDINGQVGGPPLFDRLRGIGTALDERGFLWIQEMWLSVSEMQARQLAVFRPPPGVG